MKRVSRDRRIETQQCPSGMVPNGEDNSGLCALDVCEGVGEIAGHLLS
jgi:hypothetical protein